MGDTVEEDILNPNGPGIDTQEERDVINYRPQIEYNLSRIITPDSSVLIADVPPQVQTVVAPRAEEIWNKSIDILEQIKSLQTKYEDYLKNIDATIPTNLQDTVRDAAERLGYSLEGNRIPFLVYRDILQLEDSLDKLTVTDAFESYHNDVNGDLRSELYLELMEMKIDWLDFMDFIMKGYFTQIVGLEDLPTEFKKDDPAIAKILREEEALGEAYLTARVQSYKDLKDMTNAYGLDDTKYYDSKAKHQSSEYITKRLERRVNTKAETIALIEPKIVRTQSTADTFETLLAFRPYEDSVEEIVSNVLRQYSSGQSMQNGLRNIQALIKLSVDGKIDSLRALKANAKSVSNRLNKSKIAQSLTAGAHLRNTSYDQIHALMSGFDAPPDNLAFDIFARHIVDGVEQADQIYMNQAQDFYKIHALDSDLRRGKIDNLIDKDSAREIYKIADKITRYASDRGWPGSKNLSQWVAGFVDHENLV